MLIYDKQNIVFYAILASFIHEAGHLVVMTLFGHPPQKLEFRIIGFRIENGLVRCGYTEDMTVAFAGVAINLVVFFIFYFFTPYKVFACVNLCIGGLNLIPVYPLDGARGLYFLLCRKLEEEKAENILRTVSFVTLLPLAAASFYLLINTGYNISLLILFVYLTLCYLRQ